MSVNRQNTDEELVRDSRRQQITETANETRARSGAACRGSHERHSCRSVAVEVGFEPTDELPHHTLRVLRGTVHQWFPSSATCTCSRLADSGGQCRTEVNETKTETTLVAAWLAVGSRRRLSWCGAGWP